MKRFGNIYERIYDLDNLRLAHKNARKDKTFYRAVKMVDSDEDYYLLQIQDMLKQHTYKVSKYSMQVINDKGKERELAKLPYFPDRIIQWAIMLQLGPIFEKTFCYHTCASIPARGSSHAFKLTKKYLKDIEGTKYCLKLDIRKFYPSIDREVLKKLLRRKFKDKELLMLLDKIINSSPHDKGVPIGSYLSQFLANFYLSYFDHYLKETLRLKYVVRYMDDIIVLSDSKDHLHNVLKLMDMELKESYKLEIKQNYQIFPVDVRGIDFVGYRFFHDCIILRKRTVKELKRKHCKWKKKLLDYGDYCSINSYRGILNKADCYHLSDKYITSIQNKVDLYYTNNIQRGA